MMVHGCHAYDLHVSSCKQVHRAGVPVDVWFKNLAAGRCTAYSWVWVRLECCSWLFGGCLVAADHGWQIMAGLCYIENSQRQPSDTQDATQ